MGTRRAAARKLYSLGLGVLASLAVLSAGSGPASARSFYNELGTFDADVTSTLTYPSGHPAFTLNVWSDRNCGGGLCSTTYTIRMYNSSNAQVFSAGSQTNRYYSTGSNVTRIVVTRECGCAGHNYTQR